MHSCHIQIAAKISVAESQNSNLSFDLYKWIKETWLYAIINPYFSDKMQSKMLNLVLWWHPLHNYWNSIKLFTI